MKVSWTFEGFLKLFLSKFTRKSSVSRREMVGDGKFCVENVEMQEIKADFDKDSDELMV